MKILVIASGFTGATLPLANQFSQMGHDVKCYNIVQWRLKAIESIDFDEPLHLPSGNPTLLPKSNKLYSYLSKSVDFYILPCWNRKRRMEKLLLGMIFPWLNKHLIKKYISYILLEKPDFVNIVVHSELDCLIAEALYMNKVRLCITYHEVLEGLCGNNHLKSVVKQTCKLGTPIVLHSQKTADDLIQAVNDKKISKRVSVINFGAFESFLSYGKGYVPEGLPDDYFLYLGHVHPYKGLKYLYEAVQILGEKLGSSKIVVAGGGYDPIIKKMRKKSYFMVLNHFIDNAEVVGLIRHCKAIICPYIAASQSGLVQTGMVFNKPIIATKVGAFTEFIQDGKTGYLCEPADAQSLADTILRFIVQKDNKSIHVVPQNLRWDIIAQKYINIYNELYDGA